MPVITVGDITVPDVVAQSLATGITDLEAVYLSHSETYEYSGVAGTILAQTPVGGTVVTPDQETGYTVALLVSGIFPVTQLRSQQRRVFKDLDLKRPNAPTGFNAQTSSETQLALSWNAGVDPQGTQYEYVSGVTSYKIYRNGALRTSTSLLTFTDTGLSAYTVYSYTITSIDAAGNESMQSAAIVPRTLDLTAPTVPTVVATQTGQTTISVALTVPSTDSGSGV